MGAKTMMNSTEDPSWDQDIIRSGKSLRRSLQSVLSGSGCNEAPAHVASLSTAQWNISKTAQTSNVLPRCLERHLSEALDAAPRTDDDLISILAELSTLLPHLPWINRQARADQDSAFVERHRHGMIAGPGALFECSTLTLGLALMMPKTSYPYHQHPPAEFYLVLSPGDWYREDVGWWSPGAGGVVFNPPSCIHAMRSTCVPLLALWGLIHSEAELCR
ncbi:MULTISPECIES: dimethylsulfonioproprionate lyase family protein [Pseudomonas]|uniref:dimethylsulfonioproprionate lyase family protein n=1 Tax=Pseudomonas TaxID=286 RepID=UPI000C222C6A|nr:MULTISPECIES: dimethylsulfonioproprionate lyase family protein [Pseudomonas]PJH87803.1 transcriptional regulator [Pseudomonas sp. WCS365]